MFRQVCEACFVRHKSGTYDAFQAIQSEWRGFATVCLGISEPVKLAFSRIMSYFRRINRTDLVFRLKYTAIVAVFTFCPTKLARRPVRPAPSETQVGGCTPLRTVGRLRPAGTVKRARSIGTNGIHDRHAGPGDTRMGH